MTNSKPNCAAHKPRCMILLALIAAALLLTACSSKPVAGRPQKVCALSQPKSELMQSLPAGSLSDGYLAFGDAVIKAIDAGQITAGQLIDAQHAMATRIASLGDAANVRLIALQDYVTRALERCAPD